MMECYTVLAFACQIPFKRVLVYSVSVALVHFCFCWWFFPFAIPLEGLLISSLFVAFGRLFCFFGWLFFPSRGVF